MSGAITNYELGKITHLEYEAQFSRTWGQSRGGAEETIWAKGHKFAQALGGTIAGLLVARSSDHRGRPAGYSPER